MRLKLTKYFLGFAALTIILISLTTKIIQVAYWKKIDWNLISINPLVPVLVLISSVLYTALSFLDRPYSTFRYSYIVHIVLGIAGIIYALVMLAGVFLTYAKAI